MNRDNYIKAIMKKLKCTGKKKNEIKKELMFEILIAMENGEIWQEIETRMGTPFTIASEFNDNFSDTERKAAKKIKVAKIATAVIVFIAIIVVGIYWMLPKTSALDSSSKFDEQTVTNQAEEIILLINEDDYGTIQNQYANSNMQTVFEGSRILDAKNQIASDWGEFQSFGNAYTVELTQSGKHYAVIQISVLYDNISVTYTITFDEEMKLAGLYMK